MPLCPQCEHELIVLHRKYICTNELCQFSCPASWFDSLESTDASVKQSDSGYLPGMHNEPLCTFELIAIECNNECSIYAKDKLKTVDTLLYCFLDLLLPSIERWRAGQGTDVVWQSVGNKRANGTFIFISMLNNIVNSILAVRRLAVSGLDRQARTVFRELYEVLDMTMVFLATEEYLDAYLNQPEDFSDAKKYWDEKLRPWKIRKQLHDIGKNLGLENSTSGDFDIWDLRRNTYGWLSKSVHVDFAGLTVEGVAANSTNKYELNIGGRFGPHTISTLESLAGCLIFALLMVTLLLERQHGWDASDDELHEHITCVRNFISRISVKNSCSVPVKHE